MGVLIVVVCAMALALIRGGRLPANRRDWALAATGVVLLMVSVLTWPSGSLWPVLAGIGACLTAAVFWWCHRRFTSMALVAAGSVLNLIAIPAHTRLTFLGDQIHLQTLGQVVTPGELLVLLGIFLACQSWFHPPLNRVTHRRRPPRQVPGRPSVP